MTVQLPDTSAAGGAHGVLPPVMAIGERLAPIHPGEILLEEFLRPLKLGTTRAALRMAVPRTRVERLVRGEMGVSSDTALRLERLLGASAEFWMNLQMAYDLAVARDRAEPSIAQIQPITEPT
jgi:addiction module HigA family antidote